MRDTQRSRVYWAESCLSDRPTDKKFETVPEILNYLKKITGSAWYRKRFPSKEITVADGRGCRDARCKNTWNGPRLVFPRWARSTRIVLHELAHAIQPTGSAWHGPEFCGIFLELVRKFMSKEDATTLEDRFRQKRVLYLSLEELPKRHW